MEGLAGIERRHAVLHHPLGRCASIDHQADGVEEALERLLVRADGDQHPGVAHRLGPSTTR